MEKALIDSGPLTALFDKNDNYHTAVVRFMKTYSGTLYSLLTEVTHLLDFSVHAQIDFLTWIYKGGVEVVNFHTKDLGRVIELIGKYSNVPMDLADASLLFISEVDEVRDIVTIDSDYYIYRTKKKRMLNNLLDPYLKQ